MKKLILASAATLLVAGSAQAASNNSFSQGNGPEPRAFTAKAGLDLEPTASIGTVSMGPVIMRGTEFIGGRDAHVVYTLDNGVKTIISKSYRSSDR